MDMDEEEQIGPLTARQPIRWEAYEHVYIEKSPDWYWALGLVAVAGSIAALLFNNVLFAILILIAAFTLATISSQPSNVTRFAVTQRGVQVDDKLYPYSSLESFAIDEVSPNHIPKLIINPKSFFAPLIIIPIEDVDPDDIHDFLIALVDEEDHVEPLSHRVMEWLGV